MDWKRKERKCYIFRQNRTALCRSKFYRCKIPGRIDLQYEGFLIFQHSSGRLYKGLLSLVQVITLERENFNPPQLPILSYLSLDFPVWLQRNWHRSCLQVEKNDELYVCAMQYAEEQIWGIFLMLYAFVLDRMQVQWQLKFYMKDIFYLFLSKRYI